MPTRTRRIHAVTDERPVWTEVFANGDVEADSIGGDVTVPPRSIEQDVADPGACHGESVRSRPAACPELRQRLWCGHDLALDLGCPRRGKCVLCRVLYLSHRPVGLRHRPLRAP